jgi:hypothetical protein
MIRRYVTLGIVCLVALALVYAWGVWQASKRMAEAPGRPGAADDKSRMA